MRSLDHLAVVVALSMATVAPSPLLAQSPPPAQPQPQAPAQPQPQPPAQPAARPPAQPQPSSSTPPAPAPSSAKPAAAAAAPEYKLSRGDKLRVEVYKDTFLSQSLQIRPDGRITLPLIGDLMAEGLTSIELRDRITASLKEYVANPVVTVIVVEVTEPVVYVMGEVNQPGSIPLRGPLTVVQALAMAGGFKEFANPKGIRVLRRNGDPTKVETIPFDYRAAIKADGDVLYLRQGDTVVVP